MFYFLIFILAFILFSSFISIKHYKLFSRYKKLKKFLKNYLNIITSARYGNLNIKCEQGFDNLTKKISKNSDALFESILDRDEMIKEYVKREKEIQDLKQDFISSLTHDLKVPIIAQDNTYDLFLDDRIGSLTPEQKKVIEILKISNNDLKKLIVDLLDILKLDKKEIELQLKNTNLNSLIKEIIEQNDSILKIQNKKIIFNYNNENIFFKLDEFLFKRVLNNLISNAIFYGKNSQNIYINLNKENSKITIEVIDEGEGIKEEEINSIFNKYYTSAKKYSNIGVGLGLYIANKIILAHKGKISAKNTKDKGACFEIVFEN